MAKTLYEYYSSKGQALPSVSERAKVFESQGLGTATMYKGTTEQNTALLNKLSFAPVSTIATTATPLTIPTTFTTPSGAVVGANGQTISTPTTATIATPASTAMMAEITKKLSDQLSSDMVSSEPSAFEKKIDEITQGITAGREAANKGIEAGAERLAGEIRTTGGNRATAEAESRRGYAQNLALIKQINDDTEKSLKDLELRKQEALASGAMEDAKTIASLQLEGLKFRETKKQQIVDNLIKVASFSLEAQRETRITEQQNFAEKQSIGNIALQYGINVAEGDTIDSIINRALPFATQEQKLGLEKERAEIQRIKAETQKVLQGEELAAFDDALVESFAQTLSMLDDQSPEYGTLISGISKNTITYNKVLTRLIELNKPRNFTEGEFTEIFTKAFNGGLSFNEATAQIASDPRVSNKSDAEAILRRIYKQPVPQGSVSIFQRFENMAVGVVESFAKNVLGEDIATQADRKRLDELQEKATRTRLNLEENTELDKLWTKIYKRYR